MLGFDVRVKGFVLGLVSGFRVSIGLRVHWMIRVNEEYVECEGFFLIYIKH